MRSLSVELKLVLATIFLTALAGLAGARLAGRVFEEKVEDAGRRAVAGAAEAFDAHERSEIEKLSSTLDALLGNDELRRAFSRRDREALLRLARPLLETMQQRDRITHWYFIEPDAEHRVFLRVHRPELSGDAVKRVTLARAVETRDLGAGKELGRTAFALRAVRPWIVDGAVLGYMELAEEIDSFLTAIKTRTGDDYGLLVKKAFLDQAAWARILGPRSNTWNDRPDVVVVDTTTFTEGIIDWAGDVAEIPDRGEALDHVERGDRVFVRGIFPVRDAAGRKVGGLFVLHDFTREHAAISAARAQAFVVVLALSLATAIALALAAHGLVFARLARLRRRVLALASSAGIPEARVVELSSHDEVGRLEALFERLVGPGRPRAPDDPGSAAPPAHARD